MSRILTLTHDYPYPARAVWDVATDLDALAEVMGRVMAFEGLPSGRVVAGQRVDVRVSLFGLMPWQDYSMTVEEMDEAAMWFQSDEHGAGVRSWRHHCSVVAVEDGAQLVDQVEIDAGFMTPVFVWWAGVVYRARHKPRLRLLGERLPSTTND